MMSLELDHLFIWVSAQGNEAARLTAFGLTEGPPNSHPGQGTACRRFFFANFYLELLWLSDRGEAQSDVTRPTQLWERWEGQASGACPFGLIVRPGDGHDGSIPFPGWEHRPTYLPAPLGIHVAANASILAEPMLFYLPFAKSANQYPAAKQPPLNHPAGLRKVTRVELAGPRLDHLSRELAAVAEAGLARVRLGPEHLAELGFDGESRGQMADFRPFLPLRFHW